MRGVRVYECVSMRVVCLEDTCMKKTKVVVTSSHMVSSPKEMSDMVLA
jgi:hypothetical protein